MPLKKFEPPPLIQKLKVPKTPLNLKTLCKMLAPFKGSPKIFSPLHMKFSFSPLLCPKKFAPFLGGSPIFSPTSQEIRNLPPFMGSPKFVVPLHWKSKIVTLTLPHYHPHPVNNEVSLREGLKLIGQGALPYKYYF